MKNRKLALSAILVITLYVGWLCLRFWAFWQQIQEIRSIINPAPAYAISEDQLVQGEFASATLDRQINPAIYENIIVWAEESITGNRHYQIISFDTETKNWQALTELGNSQWPDIWGDVVIWWQIYPKPEAIRGVYLSTLEPLPLPQQAFGTISSAPRISEEAVVWAERSPSGESAIIVFDIQTQTTTIIAQSPFRKSQVAISGSIVVWSDDRNGDEDIFGYDLDTGQEFVVVEKDGDQHSPDIWGDTVIWLDSRGYPADVDSYNLNTGEISPVVIRNAFQGQPAIYENIVFWEDLNKEFLDLRRNIISTNLETQTILPIVINQANNTDFDIYSDTITWVRQADGHSSIMWGRLNSAPQTPP